MPKQHNKQVIVLNYCKIISKLSRVQYVRKKAKFSLKISKAWFSTNFIFAMMKNYIWKVKIAQEKCKTD